MMMTTTTTPSSGFRRLAMASLASILAGYYYYYFGVPMAQPSVADRAYDIVTNLSIPLKMPLVTIDPNDFDEEQDFGGATLDMFRGHWVPIQKDEPYYDSSYNSNSSNNFCPLTNSECDKFSTCTTSNYNRVAKKYIAEGLQPFNASLWENFFQQNGGRPIFLVGDSLSGQMRLGLQCMIESQLGGRLRDRGMIRGLSRPLVVNPTTERMETIEIRTNPKNDDFFDTNFTWVDEVIKANASYVVFNTGAWWMNVFHVRSDDWCNWNHWNKVGSDDILKLFEETLRLRLLPQLKRLKAHGITPIWQDTPPGGVWNEEIGDVGGAEYEAAWKLHPVYNRIGRRITQAANGLVLPIFDLSMARSDDHVQMDATYTNNDQLHWCGHYSPNAVPNVWSQLLQAVLFNNEEEGKNLVEAPASSFRRRRRQRQQLMTGDPPSPDTDHQFVIQGFHSNYSYSKSVESPCPCASAMQYSHCVANIRCQWVSSSYCTDL